MIPILLIIVLLSGVNALFAASEMALVSIKPSTMYQLKQKNTKRSHILEKVIERHKFLKECRLIIVKD